MGAKYTVCSPLVAIQKEYITEQVFNDQYHFINTLQGCVINKHITQQIQAQALWSSTSALHDMAPLFSVAMAEIALAGN